MTASNHPRRLVGTALCALLLAAPALAVERPATQATPTGVRQAVGDPNPKPRAGAAGVPEIDPILGVAAAVLLAGGVLVLTGRRRRSTS